MSSSVDPATLKHYKSVIATFMSFVHGRLPGNRYNPDHDFNDVELTAVTLLDVCRYWGWRRMVQNFHLQMHILLQLNTPWLPSTKTAISFFMPNQEKWSVARTEGNPTQSKDVIDLLNAVKKKEVQKQDAKSMDDVQWMERNVRICIKFCVRLVAMANGQQCMCPCGKGMV